MKHNKLIANLLCLLTLLSLPISFSISAIVGEANIFGVAGIVRYSWIMLLFIPIGVLSLFAGKKLKNAGAKYNKLYVAAFVCLPLLLIFGSYRLIFQNISYNTDDIYTIEETIDLDLPNAIKTASFDYGGYNISYVKVTDTDEAVAFVKEISVDAHWTSKLDTMIKELLPLEIQAEVTNFDYFVFYDLSTGSYNRYPTAGECNYIFIAYDCELQRIIILNGDSTQAVIE